MWETTSDLNDKDLGDIKRENARFMEGFTVAKVSGPA
jgi:hypothetical protein